MAQIVFIINDEDGAVNVTAAAEPYIPVDPGEEITPAQSVAQLIAATLAAALAPPSEEEIQQLVLPEGLANGDSDGA